MSLMLCYHNSKFEPTKTKAILNWNALYWTRFRHACTTKIFTTLQSTDTHTLSCLLMQLWICTSINIILYHIHKELNMMILVIKYCQTEKKKWKQNGQSRIWNRNTNHSKYDNCANVIFFLAPSCTFYIYFFIHICSFKRSSSCSFL